MSLNQGLFGSYTSTSLNSAQKQTSATLLVILLLLFAVLMFGIQYGKQKPVKATTVDQIMGPIVQAQKEQVAEAVKQTEIAEVKEEVTQEFAVRKQEIAAAIKPIPLPKPVIKKTILRKPVSVNKGTVLTLIEQKAFIDDSLLLHDSLLKVYCATHPSSPTGEICHASSLL